jgi:hypothetical protein
VVLYEMVTGRRPFGEASGPQLVAKILHDTPPSPRALNPALSPVLEQVILKATDKDCELRHQRARELLVDLERLAPGTGPVGGTASRPVASRPSARPGHRLARSVVVVLSVGLLATTALLLLRRSEPRISAVRTLVSLPLGEQGLEVDDSSIYYVAPGRPTDRLMVAPLAGGPPREIPVPWRGFLALELCGIRPDPRALLITRWPPNPAELWVIPLAGGAPARVEGIERLRTAAWSPKADRLAWIETATGADRLWIGDSLGGHRVRVAEVARPPTGMSSLELESGTLGGDEVVPDALYLRRVDLGTRRVMRLPGSEGLRAPRCAPDGHIIAIDDQARRAHPPWGTQEPHMQYFRSRDPRSGTWSSLALRVPTRDGLPGGDLPYFDWSHDSRWVYAKDSLQQRVVRFDPRVGRLESVYAAAGLGESSPWFSLGPGDAPLLHRAANLSELVVMDWEVR